MDFDDGHCWKIQHAMVVATMSNAPYNGYSWQQRARIIPAYRKLTGKHAPFEGEACAMCSDPNRPPGEWHSEDYSEPFSFQPPQSFPLCKPCHTRLHKRFKAPRGEWQLFCHHLEAGGYGAEFVKLHDLAERRALCEQVASGAPIVFARIRPKGPGPHWWQNLTLDPESLVAPWARPRPLRPRPDRDAFLGAFKAVDLSDREITLLRIHAASPRRTATMRTLAREGLASDSYQAANSAYGGLARRLTSFLDWEPDLREDKSPFWMSVLAEGWTPPGREFELTMVPSAAMAVRELK
jgi:hypothetical protein